MHLPPRPSREPDEAKAANRRGSGRLVTEFLETPFGKVVDLSCSGLRVEGKGRLKLKVGDELFVLLRSIDDEVRVKAEVAWCRQNSMFRFAVGFHFLDLDPNTIQHLTHIAQNSVKKVFVDRRGRVALFDDTDH